MDRARLQSEKARLEENKRRLSRLSLRDNDENNEEEKEDIPDNPNNRFDYIFKIVIIGDAARMLAEFALSLMWLYFRHAVKPPWWKGTWIEVSTATPWQQLGWISTSKTSEWETPPSNCRYGNFMSLPSNLIKYTLFPFCTLRVCVCLCVVGL